MCAIPPAGVYPVGQYHDPLQERSSAAVFAADAISPATGEYRSILRGVDPVEGAALEALRVRFRSGSAVQRDGNKFHELEFIDEATETFLKAEIEFAWRRLIEARLIELSSVRIDAEGDAAVMVVEFVNLSTRKDGRLSLPLLALMGAP